MGIVTTHLIISAPLAVTDAHVMLNLYARQSFRLRLVALLLCLRLGWNWALLSKQKILDPAYTRPRMLFCSDEKVLAHPGLLEHVDGYPR